MFRQIFSTSIAIVVFLMIIGVAYLFFGDSFIEGIKSFNGAVIPLICMGIILKFYIKSSGE